MEIDDKTITSDLNPSSVGIITNESSKNTVITEPFSIIPWWLRKSSNINLIQFRMVVYLIETYRLRNRKKNYTASEIASETIMDCSTVRRHIKSYFLPNKILSVCGTIKIKDTYCKLYSFDFDALEKHCKQRELYATCPRHVAYEEAKGRGHVAKLNETNDLTLVDKEAKGRGHVAYEEAKGRGHVPEVREGIKPEKNKKIQFSTVSTVSTNVLGKFSVNEKDKPERWKGEEEETFNKRFAEWMIRKNV